MLSEVTGTETNVTGLTPGTNYKFSVTAENAVSSQDTNTTTITVTTLEGGISKMLLGTLCIRIYVHS